MSEQDKQKRGVAIILVVGLMGMLMLAAAAFSISMRIERQGAANYRYGVQARHMLWSALAASIEDINEMQDGGDGFKIYPEWEVIGSLQYDAGNPLYAFSTPAGVMSLTGLGHIPMYLRGAAETNVTPYWNLLEDAGGEVRGRYAYIVVNTSGLLDANVSGGAPRWMGTNACELAIADPTDAAFSIRDNTHRRYESLAELEALNPALFGMADDLGIYNLSFEGQMLETPDQVEDMVYVGGSAAELQAKRAAITNAFARSGVADPEQAYLNLIDYVDTDSVPSDLASSATEQVPMLNEFMIPNYRVEIGADSNFTATITLGLEVAYPFPVPCQANLYEVRYDAKFDANADHSVGNDFIPTGPLPATNAPVPYIPAGDYRAIPMGTIAYSGKLASPGKLHIDVFVKASVQEIGGATVDEVPSPPSADYANRWARMGIEIDNVEAGKTYTDTDWTACLDPRFNWDPGIGGFAAHWFRSQFLEFFGLSMSPNAQNQFVDLRFNPGNYSRPDTEDLDDDTGMYVANRPLKTVGELGYLAYDQWRTIRLYDHRCGIAPYPETVGGKTYPYHKVLDYFTLHDTNAIHRGLVNVNTTRPEVLATAFMGAPAGGATTNATPALAWADAMDVAADIVAAGPYTNLASIGNAVDFRSKGYVGTSELEREAPIRNTAGLLTVRNNHFTILLRSDAYTLGMGGERGGRGKTLASAHAVAEVWRDPFPMIDPSTGQAYADRVHRCFIRSFRILEE